MIPLFDLGERDGSAVESMKWNINRFFFQKNLVRQQTDLQHNSKFTASQ